jgi:hypothetical protein
VAVAVAVLYMYKPSPKPATAPGFVIPISEFTPQNVYSSSFAQTFCSKVGNVTITVWNTYSPSENQAFNASLASFEQMYPCIHVEVTYGVGLQRAISYRQQRLGRRPLFIGIRVMMPVNYSRQGCSLTYQSTYRHLSLSSIYQLQGKTST